MDFNQCACSGKSLGRLVQPAIVALLAEEPLHGYLLVQRLTDMSMFGGQKPDPAGVYRNLRAMEKDGLVVSSWDTGDSGPAKRRFELTRDGRACLAKWTQTLEEYAIALNDLVITMKRNGKSRAKPAKLCCAPGTARATSVCCRPGAKGSGCRG
jgi:poly-beta-hydroxybutyrate-responsive repressor